MTGLEGNRLSICPLRFRIASPRVPIDLGFANAQCSRVSIDRGEAKVNRNSWGGDPESQGANR